ncbi:hypothetical protein M427DRAFT_56877 [Gonapodya prolifera JEL478]|uniref:Uncharacterized protein n=1 Tax=Gonapodya prolifera (strain JEL478) TaxID=1344416 RepID=A0A139AER5_GONPJ|nr:hypothetical protein M427DRAFT_56877 [Gonapodya prolifera JEL478]|eukprot:KXS15248.1 hypothetical protein M427DRAFT_56877 [Gonapodya prolifera JEL478]
MEYSKGVKKPDPGFLAGCECERCDIETPGDCQCVAKDDVKSTPTMPWEDSPASISGLCFEPLRPVDE